MSNGIPVNEWSTISRTFPVSDILDVLYAGPTSLQECNLIDSLRRQQRLRLPLSKGVPCDVHAIGVSIESPDRLATKLFGKPARPQHLPWLVDGDGVPYEFVCQFNFSKSIDLLPQIPGDLLLVFARSTPVCNSNDPNELLFEWHQTSTLRQQPLSGMESNVHLVRKLCFWGTPFRLWDFEDVDEIWATSGSLFRDLGEPSSVDVLLQEFQPNLVAVARCRGLKIAGQPSWGPNGIPIEWASGISINNEAFDEYVYLGGFGQIEPRLRTPNPFTNISNPLVSYTEDYSLYWYDGFQYLLFWHAVHGVQWVIDYI